jgi:hypothetical protein
MFNIICRFDDNVNMNVKELGWEGVVLIHLAQDRDRWRAVVYTSNGV